MAEEKQITIKLPKVNFWQASTIVLLIILVLFLVQGQNITGKLVQTGLTPEQAAKKAIDYINNNLVQPGTSATFVSAKETNGIYNVSTSYKNQTISIYVTKDGSYVFLSSPLNTGENLPTEQPQKEFNAPDTDRPTVDLFVMSFCPYGVQAENAMKSVVDLLGTKADIKVRFIAGVQGDTVESVSSLHGINEAMEDLRQICIMKNYDQKTFWSYLMEINNNCYSLYRDATALENCWKATAKKTGIDVSKIETCSKGTEGLTLLKADEQLANKYGVSSSPTLIINGETYSGGRSSEDFKNAICSGFTTKPAECSQTLSAESTTQSGGC